MEKVKVHIEVASSLARLEELINNYLLGLKKGTVVKEVSHSSLVFRNDINEMQQQYSAIILMEISKQKEN